ncbi:MAG: hypothetical protein ABW203_09300 [Novosphingobium sp.]
MRLGTILIGSAVLAGSTLAGAAAYDWQGASGFFNAPAVRWPFDPKQDFEFHDQACPAIKRECPRLDAGDISLSVTYDELYDARGQLAGLRMIKGSGCRPLDEAILLGQREFRSHFHEDGKSDLDGLTMELGDGVEAGKVRIVKQVDLQFGNGC